MASECCKTSEKHVRYKNYETGYTFYHLHCSFCGTIIKRLSKSEVMQLDVSKVLEFDDEDYRKNREAQWKKRNDEYQEIRRLEQESNDRAWLEKYTKYLQSPEWREKRKLVMLRAQGICEGCRKANATEVHHLTYERLGDEMLFDLVAICKMCHDKIPNRFGRMA